MATLGDATALDSLLAARGDPGALPFDVVQAYRAGEVKRARRMLLAHVDDEIEPTRKQLQAELLRDLRFWLTPSKPPKPFTFNGFGTMLLGSYQLDPRDQSKVSTLWVTLLFIPLIPLRSFLVRDDGGGSFTCYGEVPLPPGVRVARWVLGPLLLVGTAAGVFVWLRRLGLVHW